MSQVACEVVIPCGSDVTHLPWPPNKIPDWESAAAYLFGGISPLAIGVIGSWVKPGSPGSTLIRDLQNRYEIAVELKRVPVLREFVRFSCAHFEQECMYFKIWTHVELVDNPLGRLTP